MKIYGLTGKAGSGKDSFYKEFQKLNPDCVRVAFADALKREIAELGELTVEYIEENKSQLRVFMQTYGTDFRRKHCGEDYWIHRLAISPSDLDKWIFVTDVRFQNEADFIRKNGGKIIRVIKTDHNAQSSHVSETEMDKIKADYTIHAKDRIELANEVKKFLAQEKPCNQQQSE